MSDTLTSPDRTFKPHTVTYAPWLGHRGRMFTEEQLQEGMRVLRGCEPIERIPGGFMAVTQRNGETGQVEKVTCWDDAGRLVRVDFIGTVFVNDKTGSYAGDQSPIFSNVYEYDEDGVCRRDSQVVVQNDFNEYVYRENGQTV